MTTRFKVLLAIFVAALAIGGYLLHEREARARTEAKKHDAELWEGVSQQRRKQDSNPGNGSKTWTTYVP